MAWLQFAYVRHWVRCCILWLFQILCMCLAWSSLLYSPLCCWRNAFVFISQMSHSFSLSPGYLSTASCQMSCIFWCFPYELVWISSVMVSWIWICTRWWRSRVVMLTFRLQNGHFYQFRISWLAASQSSDYTKFDDVILFQVLGHKNNKSRLMKIIYTLKESLLHSLICILRITL